MKLTQSIANPTTKDEEQLLRVLRYLAGTLHYNLSLHTKIQIAKKEAENIELLAFSATSGTRACHSTALFLWDVPLITSCKEACAQNQDEAELQAVSLSLSMAVHSRKLLQQLDMDQLGQDVKISLKTSSFQEELVDRQPMAMQLGLSRRNKHQQLRDQLQISRVHPYKNLAESLIYNASGEEVLAKLRIDTGAAETLALPTALCFVSLFSSSSLVGMVSLEPPMEEPQLRQLALSESCFESLSKNLAERSLTSLTVPSLSLEKIDSESLTLGSLSLPLSKGNRFSSLTEESLSLTEANLDSLIFSNWSFPTGSLTLDNLSRREDRLQSLTLQSLSLNNENSFQKMSFEQVSLQDGSLKELDENIADQNPKERAETNSFSQESFSKDQLEQKRAKTNGFSKQSFSQRISSLKMCLLIFLLWSFYMVGSALYLPTCSFKISFQNESLQSEQLVAAYRSIRSTSSLQQEELAAAYCKKSFAQQSHQKEELWKASPNKSFQQENQKQDELQDELQIAYQQQLDRDTSLSLQCFSLPRCSKNNLESFNQLDRVQSLSFQMLGSISFSYQLQADSFNRTSLELRAFLCAALFQTIRIRSSQLQSFQLTGLQLSNALASGGVQQTTSQNQLAALTLTALSRRMSAWIMHSLSLALGAFKASSSKIAWRHAAFNKSLLTSLSTTASHRTSSMGALQPRSLQKTSFHRSAFKIALAATSSRRLASPSALTRRSLSTTSSLRTTLSCFSFLVHNFSFNNSLETCQLGYLQESLRQEQPCSNQLQHDSFSDKKIEKKDELQQNLLEQELEKVLANKTCSLGPYDHLEQKLWQIQLQELSLQQNNQKQKQQLSKTVPDNKLLQLHLSQLCQQDPESAFSNQLPEEPWLASGLRTAAWPAAVQSEQPSFSKKELAEQDLSNISLEEFFPKNFGNQLSDKQLSAQQLQNKQLQKNTFQQLSLEHPSFTEKTLHKELATNFAKNSLLDNLVFQNFFFSTLALQKVASEQLGDNNLDKKQLAENNLDKQQLDKNNFPQTEEACKEQLLSTGFPAASLNQQLFSTSLVQTSEAKEASQPELPRDLLEHQLANKNLEKNSLATTSLPTRTSRRQLQKNQLEEENFTEHSFEALCLSSLKALCLPSFPEKACKEELLPEQLLQQQQLFSRDFFQDSFSASSFPGQNFNLETFQPDSFTASSLLDKSFNPGTFKTAAWQTGPSDRQL